jgi:hypothetical protein
MEHSPNIAAMEARLASLTTEPAGRIPVLERRMDSHARDIKALQRLAALLIGGGVVMIWMIDRCIQLLEISSQLKGK